MVMHARKIPRLDENYRDAGHADLLGKEKTLISRSSSKYSDRKQYEEDDRKKESPRSFKGRCEDRRAYDSNKRSKTHKQRDHKSDVHRLAERVCGDWSEHISKSGKRYFYNCLTEVSQWHKPESWIEEDPPSTQSKSEDRTSNDGSYNSRDNQSSRKNRPRNDHHKQHNHRTDWRAGRLSSSRSPNRKSHRSGSEEERGRRKEYRKDDRLSDHPPQQSKNCMYQDMDISPTSSPQASQPSSHTPINKHTSHQHNNHKHTTPHETKEARLSNNDSVNINNNTRNLSAVPNDIHDASDEPIRDNNDTPTTPSKHPTTEAGVVEGTPQGLQSTLAGLQRAVLQLNSDNNITHNNNSQSSFASCVALLPVLLTQLSNPQSSNQATNQENQLIIQQAIPLLKKLQEMVVHQQQQQQQRKLQAMLLQLLQMQKADKPPEQPPPKEKAESPYSPPDSDGSPVDHKHTSPHKHPVVSSSIEATHSSNTITTATTTTSATPPVLSSHSSVASCSSSFKYSTSTHQGLSRQTTPPTPLLPTPSRHPEAHHDVLSVMSCYVNNKLTEHVTNWNIESLNKQASCYSAEKFIAYGALCSQISPELKHARSMVRCHEILSTIHEQRVSSVRQQYYELERGVSMLPGSTHPSHQASFSTPFNQQHHTSQQHILKNQTHQTVNHPLTSPTHQPAESPIGQTILSPVLQPSNLTHNTNQKVSTPQINNLSPSIQSKIEPLLTTQTPENNLSSPSTLNPVVASVTTDNNT